MKWLGDRKPDLSEMSATVSLGYCASRRFRIIDAETGNPIAERCTIRRFDILRQIGAVSLEHIQAFFMVGPD